MHLHEITVELPKSCYGEASLVIRGSYFGVPRQILDALSDSQVVSLWQTGLQEAQQLSDHNLSTGRSSINYPHLWVKSNLFKHVYPKWSSLQEDVSCLIQSIQAVLSTQKTGQEGKEKDRTRGKELVANATGGEGRKEGSINSTPTHSSPIKPPRPGALQLAKQLGVSPIPIEVRHTDQYMETLRRNRAEIASRPKPSLTKANDSTN